MAVSVNRGHGSTPGRLRLRLPSYHVVAEAGLLTDQAPTLTRAIWESLETPISTDTHHACFDGHEVYCFLPKLARQIRPENQTMRPPVGGLMLFAAGPHEFACLYDPRLRKSDYLVELAIMYGEVDLRHFYEEGLRGSLIGIIDRGLDGFASACANTLAHGTTPISIEHMCA